MLFISSKRHIYLSVGKSLIMLVIGVVLASSCSTQFDVNSPAPIQPKLEEKQFTSFDGDPFGYQKWIPNKSEPQTVIIGVHGISGHAGDYDNLAKYLQKHSSDTAVYAPETRGQGMDANNQRRGDIYSSNEWSQDLYTFTGLIRKLHPKAKIVWFGESMGSLIILHAYSDTPKGEKKPDALVVSSPIVDINQKLEPWKYRAAHVMAALFPTLRVSLETLSSGQKAMVTEDDIHEEQAAKNPWYIRRYTLRLLLTLGDMSDELNEKAAAIDCPVLVLNGGLDIFTSEEKVTQFYSQIPNPSAKTKKFYPSSYHLLMYDHERDQIFADISQWLRKLK